MSLVGPLCVGPTLRIIYLGYPLQEAAESPEKKGKTMRSFPIPVLRVVAASVLSMSGALLVAPMGIAGAATPKVTGCPSGFERITVADAEAAGYNPVPRRADEGGNNNGIVCRNPLPEVQVELVCGTPCHVDVIYLWRDDIVFRS